jgi:hypothetical protein
VKPEFAEGDHPYDLWADFAGGWGAKPSVGKRAVAARHRCGTRRNEGEERHLGPQEASDLTIRTVGTTDSSPTAANAAIFAQKNPLME